MRIVSGRDGWREPIREERERIDAFKGSHRWLQMSPNSRLDNGTQLLLSFELQLSVCSWHYLCGNVVAGCVLNVRQI